MGRETVSILTLNEPGGPAGQAVVDEPASPAALDQVGLPEGLEVVGVGGTELELSGTPKVARTAAGRGLAVRYSLSND